MLCPGKRGERWARGVGARRRARACRLGDPSELGPPAQSVSAAAGGTQGPARTILTAAPPAARAPARLLGAAGARGPRGEGAEPPAARGGPGLRAPGCSSGPAARQGLLGSGPAGSRDSRSPACAPPAHRPRFRGGRWAHAPFLGREETLPSQLCDIRLHSRADVCRCKFKNCHWPGASGLFLSPPLPPNPTRGPWPLTSRKQGSAARPTWVPGRLRGGAADAWSLGSVSTGVLT